jgi:hypothetical protein
MRQQTRSRRTRAAMGAVERIGNHLRSNMLGLVAIFIVLGGTAYAVNGPLRGHNTVGTKDIINGQVKGRDIHKGAVRSSDVRRNDLTGRDINEASLNLTAGARAYGVVNPQACRPVPGQPVTCQVDEPTAGITQVTRPQTGVYCVRATGVDPEDDPAAVSVDQFNSEPAPGDAVAMTNTGDNCGGHMDFFVGTQRHPEVTVNQGGSQNNATVSGPAEESNMVGFTIVIP